MAGKVVQREGKFNMRLALRHESKTGSFAGIDAAATGARIELLGVSRLGELTSRSYKNGWWRSEQTLGKCPSSLFEVGLCESVVWRRKSMVEAVQASSVGRESVVLYTSLVLKEKPEPIKMF